MSTFYLNWAAFEVSTAELVDRTTHTVELHHPEHENIRLAVRSTPIPKGMTVRQVAARRMAEEMVHLAGYTVLENREIEWCEVQGVEVVARFRNGRVMYYQRQVHFAPDDVVRSFSLAGPIVSRAACDEWFEQIRTSLRMRLD